MGVDAIVHQETVDDWRCGIKGEGLAMIDVSCSRNQ